MRLVSFALVPGLLLQPVLAGAALADDCLARVQAIVADSANIRPSKGHLITETKGLPTTENEFFIASSAHMLFKPIDPPDLPWSLTYIDTNYQSADEGQTWTVGYTFDPEQQAEGSRAYVQGMADSAINAQCGSEDLDGRTLEVVEADMSTTGGDDKNYHAKYWYDSEIDLVVKSVSTTLVSGMEMTVTQTWEPAEGLDLPVPDGVE